MPGLPPILDDKGEEIAACSILLPEPPFRLLVTVTGIQRFGPIFPEPNGTYEITQNPIAPAHYRRIFTGIQFHTNYRMTNEDPFELDPSFFIGQANSDLVFRKFPLPSCLSEAVFENDWTFAFPSSTGFYGGTVIIKPF